MSADADAIIPLGHGTEICECRYAPLHGHPMDLVAQSIAKDTKVLCLDEMHVTDVADALILGQVQVFLGHRTQTACRPASHCCMLTYVDCSSSQHC